MAQRILYATVLAPSEAEASSVLYAVYGGIALLIEPQPQLVGAKGWRFKITIDAPDDLTPVGDA